MLRDFRNERDNVKGNQARNQGRNHIRYFLNKCGGIEDRMRILEFDSRTEPLVKILSVVVRRGRNKRHNRAHEDTRFMYFWKAIQTWRRRSWYKLGFFDRDFFLELIAIIDSRSYVGDVGRETIFGVFGCATAVKNLVDFIIVFSFL